MKRTRSLPVFWMLLFVVQGGLAANAADPPFQVRYRSADTVYLDAGRLAGLSVGDRLELVRDGDVVAIVEIVFLADNSSSARPVEERGEILSGDLARPLGELRPPAAEPIVEPRRPTPPAGTVSPGTMETTRPRIERRRRTRISGVISLDRESYTDDEDARDYDQTTSRLSLRGRDLGGLPLDLRVRLRSRQIDRDRVTVSSFPDDRDQDRLYELSLRYRPRSERFEVSAGRLGAGPFSGIGYVDGISGSLRIARVWHVGGFYGSRPEVRDLGFESSGTKLGVFSRWTPEAQGPWEVFVAGVREENDAGVSRDLAVLETRLGTSDGRYTLFQRAELDVGSSGRGDDGGGQLTQLALALTARLGERSRMVLSYDRYDPLLLLEDEVETPADAFRDLLRQGFRARLHFGREGGFDVSLTGGFREGEDDSTVSFGFGAGRRRPQGLSFSVDLLGFSNPYTDGALATLRSRYGFAGGHSVGVVLGSTAYEPLDGDQRTSGWARLETWFELPASLYARGDLEVLVGDDAEGQRLRLGIGYRF